MIEGARPSPRAAARRRPCTRASSSASRWAGASAPGRSAWCTRRASATAARQVALKKLAIAEAARCTPSSRSSARSPTWCTRTSCASTSSSPSKTSCTCRWSWSRGRLPRVRAPGNRGQRGGLRGGADRPAGQLPRGLLEGREPARPRPGARGPRRPRAAPTSALGAPLRAPPARQEPRAAPASRGRAPRPPPSMVRLRSRAPPARARRDRHPPGEEAPPRSQALQRAHHPLGARRHPRLRPGRPPGPRRERRVVGTPAYMSPEQAQGSRWRPRPTGTRSG